VGRLLATADGRVSLVAQNGKISRLMMEQIGLHLLEILQLNLTGDQTVPLRCAVADFDVARGVMQARALVLDTSVNTVVGNGRIDLAKETFDLRFVPRTKVSSLVALRGPVYVTGPFAQPVVRLDTGRIVARGAGALALGLLNPLLALLPLFEPGPGADSPCAELVREAQSKAPPAKR
jgi:AsmA protein